LRGRNLRRGNQFAPIPPGYPPGRPQAQPCFSGSAAIGTVTEDRPALQWLQQQVQEMMAQDALEEQEEETGQQLSQSHAPLKPSASLLRLRS